VLTIEIFRDWVLSIQGVIFIILMLVMTVLALILFRKAKKMLDAVDKVTGKIRSASSSVSEEVLRPVLQIVTLAQGIRSIRNTFKKKQGGKD